MAFKQGYSTSSMPWRNGQADSVQRDGYDAVLRAVVTQVSGMSEVTSVVRTGGSGQIDFLCGGVGQPAETWTVTLTGGGTTFTVSGSVSGAQAGGTVGTNYKTDGTSLTAKLQFKLTGSFSNGNTFSIVVAATTTPAADRWILDRWSPFNDLEDLDEALIWHGPGDGTQAIYAGIRLHENSGSSIWNWVLRGYTGYSGGSDFDNQPGINPNELFVSQWTGDSKVWIANNARRYIVVTEADGRYFSLYQGLILPFGSPNEYPYPYYLCGNKNAETSHTASTAKTAWSGFSWPHTSPSYNGQLRDLNGDWLEQQQSTALTRVNMYPKGASVLGLPGSMFARCQDMPSGDKQLIPLMLISGGVTNTPLLDVLWGVLDGAMAVTGFNNSPETVLSISGTNWVCFGETFNIGQADFYAVEMA